MHSNDIDCSYWSPDDDHGGPTTKLGFWDCKGSREIFDNRCRDSFKKIARSLAIWRNALHTPWHVMCLYMVPCAVLGQKRVCGSEGWSRTAA